MYKRYVYAVRKEIFYLEARYGKKTVLKRGFLEGKMYGENKD